MSRLLICLFLTARVSLALCQTRPNQTGSNQPWPDEKVRYSQNTDIGGNKKKQKNYKSEKDISFILKNKPKGLLWGNPCMHAETRRMGFEYALQKPGLPGTLGNRMRLSNNFGVYTKLIFTHSPFWKVILNRRVKNCREKSGDWVG